MRKYLLLWLLCVAGFSRAQEKTQLDTRLNYRQAYSRGTWLIGLQAGYSKGLFLGRNLTTQIYGGYFVANKVLVGLSASGSQEGFNSVHDVAYSIGPLIRYQLTRTRFSPFLMASYQIGQRTVSGSDTQITTQVVNTSGGPITTTSRSSIQGSGIPERLYSRSFGVGLSMSLTASLRIDIALNWQDKVNSIDSGIHFYNGLYQPQLGVYYLLGAMK